MAHRTFSPSSPRQYHPSAMQVGAGPYPPPYPTSPIFHHRPLNAMPSSPLWPAPSLTSLQSAEGVGGSTLSLVSNSSANKALKASSALISSREALPVVGILSLPPSAASTPGPYSACLSGASSIDRFSFDDLALTTMVAGGSRSAAGANDGYDSSSDFERQAGEDDERNATTPPYSTETSSTSTLTQTIEAKAKSFDRPSQKMSRKQRRSRAALEKMSKSLLNEAEKRRREEQSEDDAKSWLSIKLERRKPSNDAALECQNSQGRDRNGRRRRHRKGSNQSRASQSSKGSFLLPCSFSVDGQLNDGDVKAVRRKSIEKANSRCIEHENAQNKSSFIAEQQVVEQQKVDEQQDVAKQLIVEKTERIGVCNALPNEAAEQTNHPTTSKTSNAFEHSETNKNDDDIANSPASQRRKGKRRKKQKCAQRLSSSSTASCLSAAATIAATARETAQKHECQQIKSDAIDGRENDADEQHKTVENEECAEPFDKTNEIPQLADEMSKTEVSPNARKNLNLGADDLIINLMSRTIELDEIEPTVTASTIDMAAVRTDVEHINDVENNLERTDVDDISARNLIHENVENFIGETSEVEAKADAELEKPEGQEQQLLLEVDTNLNNAEMASNEQPENANKTESLLQLPPSINDETAAHQIPSKIDSSTNENEIVGDSEKIVDENFSVLVPEEKRNSESKKRRDKKGKGEKRSKQQKLQLENVATTAAENEQKEGEVPTESGKDSKQQKESAKSVEITEQSENVCKESAQKNEPIENIEKTIPESGEEPSSTEKKKDDAIMNVDRSKFSVLENEKSELARNEQTENIGNKRGDELEIVPKNETTENSQQLPVLRRTV